MPTERSCETCGESVGAGRKYCRYACRDRGLAEARNTFRTVCGYGALGPGTVGAIHELVVAVDLMKRGGLDVYRALDPSSPCDFMVHNQATGKTFRLEATTGRLGSSGVVVAPAGKRRTVGSTCDVLAAACHTGVVSYMDPNNLMGA